MATPHKHAEDNSANKKKPHIHAELIKQWADGATIQYRAQVAEWTDCIRNIPAWSTKHEYRVKPEPKPDSVKIRKLTYNADIDCICIQGPGKDQVNGNIMFVFDGETGVLKDVQLLAKE